MSAPKKNKLTATYNDQIYTRTTHRPYTYCSVVALIGDPNATANGCVWSWHLTESAARKGSLTGQQRKRFTVIAVVPVAAAS